MNPDELLQAFRLTNPGQFHRVLVQIQKRADTGDIEASQFLHNLAVLLASSRREPPKT